MSASAIARVYAEALFSLATERDKRAELDRELEELGEVFRENRDIRNFFASPGTPRNEKYQVIETALAPNLDSVTTGFLKLLVHKGREMFIERILAAYNALVDEAEGRMEVQLTSAVPLPEETLDGIAEEIGRIAEAKIDLESEVDPRLLGGLTIRMGDRLLDTSLHTRLRRLREQVLEG